MQAVFAANAVAITGSPHLWVCIGGRLHPWSSAAPAVNPCDSVLPTIACDVAISLA
jgi:hypothetical protein